MPHKANSGGRKQTRQTDRGRVQNKGMCKKKRNIDENNEEQNKIKLNQCFVLFFQLLN